MVNPKLDLEQELAADYRVYGLAGKHREIGERLGTLYAPLGPTPEEMHPDHVAFARACRTETANMHAPLVEEIAAHAEGAGKRADDLLWYFCLGVGAPPDMETRPVGNCSTVGMMTSAGPVVARNYDFFYFESFRHLVTTYAEGHHGHTAMWPGLIGGRYDGVNDAGVWVAIHGGGGRKQDQIKPGVGFHHLCRIVLETCSTAGEAVELLERAPHIASYNYFVADSKAMFVVEAHPQRVTVREPEAGTLVCTNHPVHPDMVELTDSPILENSRRRMEFLRAGARWARGARDGAEADKTIVGDELTDALGALMRDHTVPVCGHTDGLATFWSALCIPGQQRLAYSFGAPCRNDYILATWP